MTPDKLLSKWSIKSSSTSSEPIKSSSSLFSLLAGKIQGILTISPVGSSQMVQNIGRITMPYNKIPGTLEQGNFGSHQGIERGNQLLSGKELSLALVGICAKRK
jgi:hypothetical protein